MSKAVAKGKKLSRRRKRPGPLSADDYKGGFDHSMRAGMSGASVEWYLSHLREGKSPKGARALTLNRYRDDNDSIKRTKQHKNPRQLKRD